MFLVCSNPTPLQVIWSFSARLLQPSCNMTLSFIQALHLSFTIFWTGINPPIPTSPSCVIPRIAMGLNFVTICLMLTCKLLCNCYSPSCIVVVNHGFINLAFAFFSLDICSIRLVIVPLLTIFLLCFSSFFMHFYSLISFVISFSITFFCKMFKYSSKVTTWNWLQSTNSFIPLVFLVGRWGNENKLCILKLPRFLLLECATFLVVYKLC